jgi:hypothetical protein
MNRLGILFSELGTHAFGLVRAEAPVYPNHLACCSLAGKVE